MANKKHSHFLDDVDWNNVSFAYKTCDELAAEKNGTIEQYRQERLRGWEIMQALGFKMAKEK